MSEIPAEDEGKRGVNKVVLGSAVGLLIAAVAGVYFVFNFVNSERQRDLQAWQIRLGIVADSRAAAVEEWVDEQFAALRSLAENESLQLYMTELSLADGDESQVTDEAAQAGYLRNLLIATADREGFVEAVAAAEVSANVQRIGTAGIAITDAKGRILVATPSMPPLVGKLKEFLNKMPRGERSVFDMHLGVADQPTIGFVVPVFGIQGDQDASDVIGLIIGLKIAGRDLFNRLKQPGETEKTAETYLVRANGLSIEYLSPLKDGTEPLARTLAGDTPDLAAAYVVQNAGGFATKRDYSGEEVLVTGRLLSTIPWVVLRKVGTSEALAETDSRLTTMLVVFLMLIVVVSITIVAVWRHGTSLRAAAAAERYRIAAERFQNLGKFLRVVTDGQPNAIAAVDGEGHYTFANKAAAAGTGMEAEELLGKAMVSVVGSIKAKALGDLNKEMMEDSEPKSATHTFEEEDGIRIYHSDHIPLSGDRDNPPGALMIIDDITELVNERQRRERILRQLVTTLVHFVDQRDPYSADHSSRVAEVSSAIAQEMDLEEDEIRTVDIAGNLMNLGKLLVPADILTKTGNLTDEELQQIRNSVLESADLLDNVEFDGPVVDTIRQIQEHWDGSGMPKGLRAEEILLSARIVSVANAFVGMASARAYREGVPFEKVWGILLGETGTKFDRRAVSALINHVENRGGREGWAHYGKKPAEMA
ncbi:MAG: PAS domain S-box protein [Proteobacteria bacterium]|nr:PAS domain S-box protein [Pseudomonadota bacterium]